MPMPAPVLFWIILGWKHARTGPKGLPFAPRFNVLGCALDLSQIPQGIVVTENKPGRLDRIKQHLAEIKQSGRITCMKPRCSMDL